MLRISQLNIGFKNRPLLKNAFSDNFERGSFIGIIGRNGSGKSTFLRHLAGLSSPLSGQIFLDDIEYRDYSPLSLAKKLSWVGTERLLYNYLSIEEMVSLGRHPHLFFGGQLNSKDKEIVVDAIKKMGIEHLSKKLLSECSDGEKQSAVLARAFAQDSSVILLDEITAHLDFVHRHKSFTLLKNLAHHERKLIMLATHEIDLSLRYCDELLVLHNGVFNRVKPAGIQNSNFLDDIFEGFLKY